ncbi:MAG TPA: zf-HC2 domain-containing protein, partial [bacterium]|nr:zf-HC2 domain-containing protein [bacterium]
MLHLSTELTAYLDGTLTAEEASAVAAHLAECAGCRATLDDLRAVRTLLHGVPSLRPDPAALARTLARIERVETRQIFPRWLIAVATTAAGIALLLQLRVPTAPPQYNRVSPLWYFQQQAEFAAVHPMADVTLTS